MELQQHVDAFEQAGIGIVVITYDAPELQQDFIDAEGITYPFISDIDAATMVALGILNEDNQPGDRTYGIPHPGVFVVNPQQEIVGKIFVESYRIRVDGDRRPQLRPAACWSKGASPPFAPRGSVPRGSEGPWAVSGYCC